MGYTDGWAIFDNDFVALVDALDGNGVISGLTAAQHGTPQMKVVIAVGKAVANGSYVSKASATDVTITAADATNPRKDIISLASDGTLTCTAGTPAAAVPSGQTGPNTLQPAPPNIPSNEIIIAEVWIGAGATLINDADITDRRVITELVTGRSATKVVAASDSLNKENADYKCSGTADEEWIQAAFDALAAAGGKVLLLEGTYDISATLQQPNKVALFGSGVQTILQSSGSLSYLLTNSGGGNGSQDIEVAHLTFKGEGATTANAIFGDADGGNYNDRWNIHHCHFYDIGEPGVGSGQVIYVINTRDFFFTNNYCQDIFNGPVVGVQGGRIVFANNIIRRHGDNAITVGAGYNTAPVTAVIEGNIIDGEGLGNSGGIEALYATDISIVGNTVKNISLAGISVHKYTHPTGVRRATIVGNVVEECDRFGIYIQDSKYVSVTGNVVLKSGWSGIWVEGTEVDFDMYVNISGNVVMNNGQSASDQRSGVRVASGSFVTIQGNTLADDQESPTQKYGIYIDGPGVCSNIVVGDNHFAGNVTAEIGSGEAGEPVGAENSGTDSIASGQTTKAVTHGLPTTPTLINIAFREQGTNDYGRWWLSAIGATTFTLNVSADPGASNLDFAWEAKVR